MKESCNSVAKLPSLHDLSVRMFKSTNYSFNRKFQLNSSSSFFTGTGATQKWSSYCWSTVLTTMHRMLKAIHHCKFEQFMVGHLLCEANVALTYPLLSCPNWSLAFSDEIMLEGFCWWGNQLISVSLTETITIQQNKKISCKITEEPKMYFEVASLQTVLDCDHVVTCCDTNRPVGCEM